MASIYRTESGTRAKEFSSRVAKNLSRADVAKGHILEKYRKRCLLGARFESNGRGNAKVQRGDNIALTHIFPQNKIGRILSFKKN